MFVILQATGHPDDPGMAIFDAMDGTPPVVVSDIAQLIVLFQAMQAVGAVVENHGDHLVMRLVIAASVDA